MGKQGDEPCRLDYVQACKCVGSLCELDQLLGGMVEAERMRWPALRSGDRGERGERENEGASESERASGEQRRNASAARASRGKICIPAERGSMRTHT